MSFFRFIKHVRRPDMDQIEYLTFYYSTGTAMNASVNYVLKQENGQYSVLVCPSGTAPEKAFLCEVEETFADEISDVLKKYHVGSWNGFHRASKHILDGNSFSLNVHFHSGKSIHAHGYMKWPKNYRTVRSELDRLFKNIMSRNG